MPAAFLGATLLSPLCVPPRAPANQVSPLQKPRRSTHDAMMPAPIVIYTALQMEADAVSRRLPDVRVCVIGLRATRVPADVPRDAIHVLAGLAGGLDPALKVGDVVIDAADAAIATGRIHTSPHPITTPVEKAKLFRVTGARAVDMEADRLRQSLDDASARLIH